MPPAIEIAQDHSRFDPDPLARGVDLDALQGPKMDDEAALDCAVPGHIVAARSNGDAKVAHVRNAARAMMAATPAAWTMAAGRRSRMPFHTARAVS